MQLTFMAWQESRGASNLDPHGPAWERFAAWWNLMSGNFTSIKDAVYRAWDGAQHDRVDAWWKQIIESQPSITSG